MSQFRHVLLMPHKGLKDATLNSLERINVFCGPNNSGKTTALECLATPKLHMLGLAEITQPWHPRWPHPTP
jgi:recombinational DNA repair ATPase RecF